MITLFRLLVILALIQSVFTGCGRKPDPSSAGSGKPLKERVQQVVEPLIEHGWAQGIVVGVTQQGKEQYFSFGKIGDGSGKQPDENSVFEIGSMTKVFTAILLSEMDQQAEISMEDTVDMHLPDDWEFPDVPKANLTLADLASHTSGLPVIPGNFWKEGDNIFDSNLAGKRWQGYSTSDLKEYFLNPQPPIANSGQFQYSNLGAGLLGYALELSSEKSLSDLIEQKICQPLQMLQTSFSASATVPGHNADGEQMDHWQVEDSALAGAFGLKSTASDLIKFAQASLVPPDDSLGKALKLAQEPRLQYNEFEKTALGWRVNKYGAVYCSGATGGFRCSLFLHPASQTAVVVLANTQVGGALGSTAYTLDTVAGSLLNVSLNAAPIEIRLAKMGSVETSSLQDYVGYYEPENGNADPSFPVRVEGDKLMTDGPGEIPMRLWPSEKDVFFLRNYTSNLRFNRSDSGEITGVMLEFEGQSTSLVKRPLP